MPYSGSGAGVPEVDVASSVVADVELFGRVQRVSLADAARLRLEDAAPARSFPAWRGKRNYEGLYWSTTAGAHLGFESLFEKSALMMLDRDPDVVAVSCQPLWLRWSSGSITRHAPDVFVRRSSGQVVLIDVRPAEKVDERSAAVFALTATSCALAGFEYRVISDIGRQYARNLLFLARYRAAPFAAPRVAVDRARAVDRGVSVQELVGALGGDRLEAMGWVFSMIWDGVFEVDLDEPLSLRTRLRPSAWFAVEGER